MFWRYSLKETKVMLNLTILLFSVFAVLFIEKLHHSLSIDVSEITANTVGVYASVEENNVNTLMVQLNKRERELDNREAALIEKGNIDDKNNLLLIFLVGVSLFGLILLNFYLDFKKRLSLAD